MNLSKGVLPMLITSLMTETSATKLFEPFRISHKDLISNKNKESFLNELSNVGLISITDIPNYKNVKDKAMSWNLHQCSRDSKTARKFEYGDGTIRYTLATHTVPGPGGLQKIKHDLLNESCTTFAEYSDDMRSIVQKVTQDFASVLSKSLHMKKNTVMMETENGYSFNEFKDVVQNGEHLEHFHSYQKSKELEGESETIEMHSDQGLFIVFTPGTIVSQEDYRRSDSIAQGFHIGLANGEKVMVNFTEDDDLVIMLGDGVNQYVNPKIQYHQLRATPHSLEAPTTIDENHARVWYGRMILPPANAYISEREMTYGEARNLMIEESSKGNDLKSNDIGCSSSLVVRHLEETDCGDTAIYCWHRCMNHTEYVPDISPEVCASRSLELKCVNPRDQLYIEGHGDYYPNCTDSTQNATDFPDLPGYPRSEGICTEEAYEEFSKMGDYDACYAIGEFNKAVLCWTILESGDVDARLAFNGLFGWIGLGFANPEGGLNGMKGSNVILAIPGGNYNARDGLDLSIAMSAAEYRLDDDKTRYRHWEDSKKSLNTTDYSLESTDCFTALRFTKDSINEFKFNVEGGEDNLIWAANEQNLYVDYHGPQTRDNFYVNWKAGEGFSQAEVLSRDEGEETEAVSAGSGDTSDAPLPSSYLASLLLLGFVLLGY